MSETGGVVIGLSAVVIAAGAHGPEILLSGGDDALGLPFGSFDPIGHRTFELAVRDFVTAQTGFALGYVEQLYTFGDKGREAPLASMGGEGVDARVVSVGYIAIASSIPLDQSREGTWVDWYRYFPWEDQRTASGWIARDALLPVLSEWAKTAEQRSRTNLAFGLNGAVWQESQVLDRYELLYEAGLVIEAVRDRQRRKSGDPTTIDTGQPLASDHRRILATAIGRLRSKIKYRPIVFDLAPDVFTLSQLQDLVEALCGVRLHKQNFRRTLERSGLVEATGTMELETGGRPAMLFTRSVSSKAPGAPGLSLPLAKR